MILNVGNSHSSTLYIKEIHIKIWNFTLCFQFSKCRNKFLQVNVSCMFMFHWQVFLETLRNECVLVSFSLWTQSVAPSNFASTLGKCLVCRVVKLALTIRPITKVHMTQMRVSFFSITFIWNMFVLINTSKLSLRCVCRNSWLHVKCLILTKMGIYQ
jgi:hypothetical protein